MTQFAYPVTSENPTGAPFPMLKASGTVEDARGGVSSLCPFGDSQTMALWRVRTDLYDDVDVSAVLPLSDADPEPSKTRGQEVAEKIFVIQRSGDNCMSVRMTGCDHLLWHSGDEWIMQRRLDQMRKVIASVVDAERTHAARQATEDAASQWSCMMA